ncbi:reverse transcriptase domain-containing protein [Tanacetum coccineum]
MADNRTIEELLQAPTEGYGEAIVIPEINADHFKIKTNLLQLVQASPFHGFERDNPHTHINNFKRITSTLKFRGVPNDVIKLMMFPYSLEGAARIWYDKEPPNSILTWDDLTFSEAWEQFKEMLRACPHHGFTELTQIDTFYNGLNENDQDSLNAAAGVNLLSKTTREALNIIENKSKVRYSRNKPNVSRVNSTSREISSKMDERIDKLADQISTLVEIVTNKVVTPATVKAVEEICVTCGGPHAYYNCPNTDSNQSSVCAAIVQQGVPNEFSSNFKNEIQNTMKIQQTVLINQQNAFQNNLQNMLSGFFQNQASTLGTLPSNTIPNPKGEMKAITTRSGVAYEGPSIPTNPSPKKVVERETEEATYKEQTNFQGSTAYIQPSLIPIPIPEPDVPSTLPKPNIPYPSRLNQSAPLNENCSAVLLKKLPEKLGDPGKFLIPCDFPRMVECSALADLGASINLMPLSVWKILSLPELTTTHMTLELADRPITRPKGVIEDVFVKVGKFHFLADFVVVDFDADPRVPLIFYRPFLRTSRALIDVYGEEITLRFNDEAITFNLGQTSRYSSDPYVESINQIDIIDVACDEYSQEVPGFTDGFKSGNPTSTDPIIATLFPSLTPFEGGDFILEEIENCLSNGSIPPGIDDEDFDSEGDICLIEKLLNDDPF